eukprot:g8336.t1
MCNSSARNFLFALLGTLLLAAQAYECTLLDLFTRKLEIKTSARTDCTTFEGVGFIEQNGYDSLYGILTDGLTIENMILNYSVMGDGGAKTFADWYTSSRPASLQRVLLQLNDISDIGVKAVTKALCPANTGCDTSPVKELSFHSNDIGYDGAAAVAKLLVNTDRGLEIVDLGENHIGESGGTVLGNVSENTNIAYKTHTNISTLGLEGKHILKAFDFILRSIWS